MIRNIRYRKAVIRPAVVICRARRHVERAASTTTSNTEAVASSSNIASAGADKRTSPKPVEKGVLAVKQMQWMPSVAHRTSATALRREKVAEDAHGTRPVNVDGVLEARPAGLRRRALLGGASEAPPEQQQQQVTGMASEQRVSGWPVLLNADSGDSSSVASMSATQRFRRKRELERLAAAGNEDAVEALRAMGSTLGSSSADSIGGRSEENGGRRLIPVSSGVSLLFVLVAAGCSYMAVKGGGLIPPKWLSSIGDGSGFGGARSEGHHGFGDQKDGESAEVEEQQQQQQLSQGSRVNAGIVDAEAEVAIAMGFKTSQDGPHRDRAETRQREPLWLKRLRYLEPPKSST